MAHGDITHIDIPVRDMQAASRFSGTLFGWDIREIPGFEGYPLWSAPNWWASFRDPDGNEIGLFEGATGGGD